MLEINDITVSYTKDKEVLKGLSVTYEPGLMHGLVGLNGAGKTTLLNTMFGLLKPSSGSILFDGRAVDRAEIGYLESENYFYSNITAPEYLSLFKNDNFDFDNWNALFGLPVDQITDSYSTGMKKKLALMSIIKLNRQLLILDEPFNGLDLETCRLLQLILQNLRGMGKTIIITSHILESLTTICDKIHYLKDGRILFTKERNSFSELEAEIFGNYNEEKQVQIEELTKSL